MTSAVGNKAEFKGPFLELASNQQEKLKYLALFLMTLDHFATINLVASHWLHYPGRIVFPLFAYLMVYNFIHRTSNKINYLSKLLIWAVITQPIYSNAFSKDFDFLNILFSLFFGLLFIASYEKLKQWLDKPKSKILEFFVVVPVAITAFLAFAMVGSYLSYLHFGLIMIFLIYAYLKKGDVLLFIGLCFSIYILNLPTANPYQFASALLVFPAIWSIKFINIEIKRLPGWLFYLYYPTHLFILKIAS